MRNEDIQKKACTETLKLLGDFWTLTIIDVLQKEPLRFCGIERALGNINPVTLTKRLQHLEKEGLVRRTEDEENASVSYALTNMGRETLPVIKALNSYAKRVYMHKKSVVSE